MRKWINIDFGISPADPKPSRLDEAEITYLYSEWKTFGSKNLLGTTLAGRDVWTQDLASNHQVFEVNDPSECYAIVEESPTGWKILQEIQVKPTSRRNGLAGDLLVFMTHEFKRLMIGQQMSRELDQLVEKMVSSHVVTASVANLSTGQMVEYDPDRDEGLALYDIEIMKRPPIVDDNPLAIVWVLEPYRRPRAPILSEMIRRGPRLV